MPTFLDGVYNVIGVNFIPSLCADRFNFDNLLAGMVSKGKEMLFKIGENLE